MNDSTKSAVNAAEIDLDALTRDEKSMLLYAETVVVDHGGLIEGPRINSDDLAALKKFKGEGLLDFGRIPAALLGTFRRGVTHWVTFHDGAWTLAHRLRRDRAARPNAARREVDQWLTNSAGA